jgi:uncharacterized protein involved in exopolysaccharide biosynthesis
MTDRLITVPHQQLSLLSARDVAAIGFRQRRIFIVSFIAISIGATAALFLHPKYEAQMQLLVTMDRVDPVVTGEANSPQGQLLMGVSEEDLRSETELMKSPGLLSQVVEETGLYLPEPRFFGLLAPHSISDQHEKDILVAQSTIELGKKLKIEPVRKTNLISVSYKSRYPELSTKVVRSLASHYLEKHAAVHRRPESFKFFEKQTQEFHERAIAAQERLQDFDIKGNVVAAQAEKQDVLQKLAEFQGTLGTTETEIADTASRLQALQRKEAGTPGRRVTTVRTADNGMSEGQIETTLLDLQLKYSEMKTKYAPEYGPLREVKTQIEQTERALTEAKRNLVREETQDLDPTHDWIQSELAKASVDLPALKSRQTATAQIVRQYRDAARKLDAQQVTQDALIRDAKVAEDNYLLYLRKMEEARISDALDEKKIVNVAIADPATVPVLPAGFGLIVNMLIIGCASLFVSVSLVFVADRFDPSFRTPDEVRAYLETSVLANLPRNGK